VSIFKRKAKSGGAESVGPSAQPSQLLILQRVRNRVIEQLELLASYDLQWRLESVEYAPYEAINGWEDRVGTPPDHFVEPVFSSDEVGAIERVHEAWDRAATELPDNYPPLEIVQAQPYWQNLRDVSAEALDVFSRRGKLSEDTEISQ
jgi:hypothetical protein